MHQTIEVRSSSIAACQIGGINVQSHRSSVIPRGIDVSLVRRQYRSLALYTAPIRRPDGTDGCEAKEARKESCWAGQHLDENDVKGSLWDGEDVHCVGPWSFYIAIWGDDHPSTTMSPSRRQLPLCCL